jgi:hypothetical protein
MTLAIDMSQIFEVGFVDGTKVDVKRGSFYLDAYEFVESRSDETATEDSFWVAPGGRGGPVTCHGFSFTRGDVRYAKGEHGPVEKMVMVSGPITSIAWVRWFRT